MNLFNLDMYTPEIITQLQNNEIFVFGSNIAGRHGSGAARFAMEQFGAQWGVGVGRTGRCYAIPTMQGELQSIADYVNDFVDYAKIHSDMHFLVTKIGCGIAGYSISQIAPLFSKTLQLTNVSLPREFVNELNKSIAYDNYNILHALGLNNTYCIGEDIYAGEYPGAVSQSEAAYKVALFERAGVHHFIDLTEDGELLPYSQLLSSECSHFRFPIKDRSVPTSFNTMYQIVHLIQNLRSQNKRMYIHCWGGVGRTGTAIACYFVSIGYTPEASLLKLSVLWRACAKSSKRSRSPEYNIQREFVRQFSLYIIKNRLYHLNNI